MEYLSKSVEKTGEIAERLAERIVSLEKDAVGGERAVVIALEGELGAGKTTFAKAFAKALGVEQKLTSPTFVIMRKYSLDISRFQSLIHIDAYRLNNGEELKLLGIEEIISDPENIVLVEWAERVAEILPEKHITVHIDHISENERKILIQ